MRLLDCIRNVEAELFIYMEITWCRLPSVVCPPTNKLQGEIARKMKTPRIDDPDVDVCELVSDWLNEDDSGQWLMILNNTDNPDLFFRPIDSKAPNQVSMTKKPLIDCLPKRLDSKRSLIITQETDSLGRICPMENRTLKSFHLRCKKPENCYDLKQTALQTAGVIQIPTHC